MNMMSRLTQWPGHGVHPWSLVRLHGLDGWILHSRVPDGSVAAFSAVKVKLTRLYPRPGTDAGLGAKTKPRSRSFTFLHDSAACSLHRRQVGCGGRGHGLGRSASLVSTMTLLLVPNTSTWDDLRRWKTIKCEMFATHLAIYISSSYAGFCDEYYNMKFI